MKSHTTLLFSLLLVLCLSAAPSAMAASAEDEVLQVATNFVKAWNTLDFELLSSLYLHSSKTTEFGPANYNPFLYQSWEVLEKEWNAIFKLPKGTDAISYHNPQVTMLGDNVAIITLYHNFIYTDPATKKQDIDQQRITHVVQKINGKWLIVHHHASSFLSNEQDPE